MATILLCAASQKNRFFIAVNADCRPRPTRLRELAEAGQFKAPAHCEIHVGEEDWQSIPANVQAFGGLTGIAITVVPKSGHDLGKKYVGPRLDRWFEERKQS